MDGIVKIEESKEEEDGSLKRAPFALDEDMVENTATKVKDEEKKDKFKTEKSSEEQVDEMAEKVS